MELLSQRIAAAFLLEVIHQSIFHLLYEKSRWKAAFLRMERRLF